VAQIDKKQKNLIIGISAAVLIVILAIGIAVWVLAGNKEEPKASNTPYVNNTPTQAQAQQVGSIALTPAAISLVRAPDGKIAGTAEVAALFQDFYFTSIKFEGDDRLSYTSNCPTGSTPLKAGSRCQVSIALNESSTRKDVSPSPTLVIVGETTTPGGNKVTAEGRATLSGTAPGAAGTNPDGTPLAGAGLPGAAGTVAGTGTPLTSGGVAPGGIDPYGPVQPSQGSSPPVNYAQQGSSQQVNQGPPPLSPREQFILARRQAVLGNVVLRNAQTNQVVSTGDWDEIGVKKAVSSAPQDMSRVVTMDRVITAVLARPFDSRQSQQVVAQVDRNVYGAMGRNILIPRGSTIVGQMAGGSDRVAVIWTQIIRPDGARFVFNGTGGDAMGQAGVPGRVNNRWLARIGAGVLGTVLKVSTALATNAQEQAVATNNNAGGAANNAATTARNNGAIVTDIVTQDINSILGPIIQRQQALLPIITVPAGTRMTILPTQDLVMRAVDRPTVVRPSYPRQMNGGAQISAPPEAQGGGQVNYDRPNAEPQPDVSYGNNRQQQATQQSIARSLSSTPTAPSTTPPWGSN
jgi:hypothetical protein